MFESLSKKLESAFKNIRGQGRLTEANMDEALKEIRLALLEADVNFKVVKKFIEEVKEAAIGEKVLDSIAPGQQIVKIVHDELVKIMGTSGATLKMADGSVATVKVQNPANLDKVKVGDTILIRYLAAVEISVKGKKR